MAGTFAPPPLRLLHLEDSIADAELVQALLAGEWPACRIERVQTRRDFVGALERDSYDLILSDFSLPGFDGLSALDLARQIRPDLPYIFLSGTIGEENAVEALKKGAIDYVIKDRMGRLVPAIRRALEERSVRAHRRTIDQRIREQADLLDKARDAICVIDTEGRITYWNQSAERLFGWSQAEACGRRLTELLFRGDASIYLRAREAMLDDDAWSRELQIKARNGRPLTVESRWTLVRGAKGEPQAVLLLNTDVTDQKRLEQEFLRAQRLESVGMLAGGIAHDLNNVLAPILMSVHLLQEKAPDEAMRRLLGVLETSAQHGAGLIRQVLAFSRGVEGERVDLQPQVVIGDVARLVAEILPRSISIKTNSPRETWPVHSNPTQLSQVLMNLCVNARDAMPDGGSLTVCAENVQVDDALAAANPGAKAGPHVLITVADTGGGIPAEIIDRIFDPFFSTKTAGRGTGLGLSTVLGIVKSHGGFLSVASEVGCGTTFHLYFPGLPAGKKAAEARSVTAAARGRGETILVIDDEEAVRAVISAILEANGYHAVLAEDGASGVELYRQRPGAYAAVLTDMMMPAMQGPQVIRQILAINPEARLVAMSGLLGDQKGLPETGSKIVYLQKPMTGAELLRSVQQVMGGGPKT